MNINQLPLLILENIFLKLNTRDRIRLKRVCKLWFDLLSQLLRLPHVRLRVTSYESPVHLSPFDDLTGNSFALNYNQCLVFLNSTSYNGTSISLSSPPEQEKYVVHLARFVVESWRNLSFLEIAVINYRETLSDLINFRIAPFVNSMHIYDGHQDLKVAEGYLKYFKNLQQIFLDDHNLEGHVESFFKHLEGTKLTSVGFSKLYGASTETKTQLVSQLITHKLEFENLKKLTLGSLDSNDLKILFNQGVNNFIGLHKLDLSDISRYKRKDLLFLNKLKHLQNLKLSLGPYNKRTERNSKLSQKLRLSKNLTELYLGEFSNTYNYCHKIVSRCCNLETIALHQTGNLRKRSENEYYLTNLIKLGELKHLKQLRITVHPSIKEELRDLITTSESLRFLNLRLDEEEFEKKSFWHQRWRKYYISSTFYNKAKLKEKAKFVLTTDKDFFSYYDPEKLPNVTVRFRDFMDPCYLRHCYLLGLNQRKREIFEYKKFRLKHQ